MLEESPNILLVISDSTRADKLSCYGYHRKTTPNVDQLAKEGAKFINATPQGVWTLPSHASLFTGLYPSEHGLLYGKENLDVKLDKNLQTLAEYLKSKGYITIGISNNPWVGNLSGLDRGFDFFMESDGTIKNNLGINIKHLLQIELIKRAGFLTKRFLFKLLIPYLIKRPVFTKFSVEIMMNLIEEIMRRGEKFFLFANFMDTHQPYYPPRRNLKQVGAKPRLSTYVNYRIYNYYEGKEQTNIKTGLNDYYDGSLNYLDEQLGRLFSMMAKKSIIDDTFIVFTSDHGKNLGERSVQDRMAFMKDNILRVPLIIRYPRRVPQDKEIDSEVQLMDIYYTILELVGENTIRKHKNDLTLLGIVAGENRGYSYVEAVLPFNVLQERSMKEGERDYIECIRTKERKLLDSRNKGLIYYDLLKDPAEGSPAQNLDELNIDELKSYLDLQRKIIRKRGKDKLEDTIKRLKRRGKV